MKPNELRIGNICDMVFDDNSTHWKVIDIDDIVMFLRNPLTLTPIPLTEEWLLKFVPKVGHIGIEDGSLFVNTQKHEIHICAERDRIIITDIKYVHQLQNIYFALTGEELTLKR